MTFDELTSGDESTNRIALPLGRARSLYKAAQAAAALEGEFWECGTFRGGSARMLAEVLRDRPRPLRLFDTFHGFEGISPQDGGHHSSGAMSYGDIEDIKRFIAADFVSVHPGAIPSGFTGLEGSRIAFLNLDVDLYQPTRDALRFVLPRMVRGGTVIIDDYGDPLFPGVRAAVEEVVGRGCAEMTQFTSPDWGYQGRLVVDGELYRRSHSRPELAVLIAATGGERYTKYAAPLIASLRKFFPPHDVVLFTDSEGPFDAIKVHRGPLGWPDATLLRYHGLLEHCGLLSQYGRLFCLDVDMLVCSPVGLEEISSQGITATVHPGFPTTFERRRESTAFVGGNPTYYCGGVVGGETGSFLRMAEAIAGSIDADRANGITAVWHDESHLNRYLHDHPPARVLTPAYCFTEQASAYFGRWMECSPDRFVPKVRHLEKEGQAEWKAPQAGGRKAREEDGRALIGILTCKEERYARRQAAQERTWVPLARQAGYAVEFFDGGRLGVPDGYGSLPLKVKALCAWALKHGHRSLLKADDDSYFHMKNLRVPQGDYAGVRIPRNDLGTSRLGKGPFPSGTTKFDYASGGAYWLSERAMRLIVEAPIGDEWAEDRWVGQVLGRAGIHLTELRDFIVNATTLPPHRPAYFTTRLNGSLASVAQLAEPEDIVLCHEVLSGKRPPPPPPRAVPSRRPAVSPTIIMPVPLPQRPQPQPRPMPAPQPRQDWHSTILGSKINHAVKRGFRVAAVCDMGSDHHMRLRQALPGYLEETVDTPQGKKILFLIR